MKTQFRCPNCDKRMSADSRFAGRTVPCPICGAQILIPSGAASTERASTERGAPESSHTEPLQTEEPRTEQSPAAEPIAERAGVSDDPKLNDDFELLSPDSEAPKTSDSTGTITSTRTGTTATSYGARNVDAEGRYFISPPFPFEPPAPDPADPMLENFPCYAPNPFAVSFPLDQTAPNDAGNDDDDDSDDGFASKMPSVDELIN